MSVTEEQIQEALDLVGKKLASMDFDLDDTDKKETA